MKFDANSSIRRILKLSWCITALSATLGLLGGGAFGIGALAGGVLATLNVEFLARWTERLSSHRPGSLSWLGAVGILSRYILLCFALFVIIRVWRANMIAVAVGLSAPVAAVFVECGLTIVRELKQNRADQP